MRIDWIDRAKGILIALVVLWHAAGSAANATVGPEREAYRQLYKFIYLFHMPAFFFLAGMTSSGFAFSRKFRRLLIPYFAFGLISAAVYLAAAGTASNWWHPLASVAYGAAFPGTDGLRCNSVLWFPPCLFSVLLFSRVLIRLADRLKYGKVLLSATALFSPFLHIAMNRVGLPQLPFGMSLLFRYLPYVLLGGLLSAFLKSDSRSAIPVLPAATLLFLFTFPLAPFDWSMQYQYGRGFLYAVSGVLGTLACVFAAVKIKARPLVYLGGMSLGVMMTHKWFVLLLNRLGLYNALVVFPISTAGAVLLTAALRKTAPWLLGESVPK